MKDIYTYKNSDIGSLPIGFKDVDGKKGIVTGYFAAFDNVDSDGEIIRKGAFLKSISDTGPASSKPRVKHLLNHDPSQPLGVLQMLMEDAKGLYYESRLGTHSLGQDFIKMVESGLITEHSIGFQVMKYNQLKPWNDVRPGEAARELTDVKLWEGSCLTAWGANENTPLTGMKSEQKAKRINDRVDLLIKALRNGTFTDETFDLLEIELRQLQQLAIDMTKEQERATLEVSNEEVLSSFDRFIKNL